MFVAALASTALFTKFASELVEGDLAKPDSLTHEWAAAARSPGADAFFGIATVLGSWFVLLPICVISAVLLYRRRHRLGIIAVVLAPVIASSVMHLLKTYYSRPRPNGALTDGFSFPSGHTTNATAVALTVGYVLVRQRIVAKPHFGWAILFALIVGASRVYLGAHWASDVLGGWITGTATALFCMALYERLVGSAAKVR